MLRNWLHIAGLLVRVKQCCQCQWRHWGWGRTAPGDTLQGVTHEGKILSLNLQRTVDT